jgi:hypothetical protein
MGYMPLPLLDGMMHYQPFLINKHTADTIMPPKYILNNNHWFASWQQEGHKVTSGLTAGHPGSLSFFDSAGSLLFHFNSTDRMDCTIALTLPWS